MSDVKGLIATKVGMTQLFNEKGTVDVVTVLQVDGCRVLGLRTPEKDGYAAVRMTVGTARRGRLNKPALGEFKKAGIEPGRRIVELRTDAAYEVGQELGADVFAPGELVDVTGVSKGKGFQGMVKRHNFGRGPETHGSMNVRKPGSIGATDAARVFKGVRMAGHMGNRRSTVQGLKVIRVDPDRNLILVRGGVPGPAGQLVMIRQSVKTRTKKA